MSIRAARECGGFSTSTTAGAIASASGRSALAVAVLEKRRTEIGEAKYFPNAHRRAVLFDDLLDDYRKWAKREDRAIIKGEGCYARLLDTFGGKRAESITLADVECFKHALGELLCVATVNRNLTLLRAVFKRGIRPSRIITSRCRISRVSQPGNFLGTALSATN